MAFLAPSLLGAINEIAVSRKERWALQKHAVKSMVDFKSSAPRRCSIADRAALYELLSTAAGTRISHPQAAHALLRVLEVPMFGKRMSDLVQRRNASAHPEGDPTLLPELRTALASIDPAALASRAASFRAARAPEPQAAAVMGQLQAAQANLGTDVTKEQPALFGDLAHSERGNFTNALKEDIKKDIMADLKFNAAELQDLKQQVLVLKEKMNGMVDSLDVVVRKKADLEYVDEGLAKKADQIAELKQDKANIDSVEQLFRGAAIELTNAMDLKLQDAFAKLADVGQQVELLADASQGNLEKLGEKLASEAKDLVDELQAGLKKRLDLLEANFETLEDETYKKRVVDMADAVVHHRLEKLEEQLSSVAKLSEENMSYVDEQFKMKANSSFVEEQIAAMNNGSQENLAELRRYAVSCDERAATACIALETRLRWLESSP